METGTDRKARIEQAFNFTEADLRENRQGRLSTAQVDRLRSSARQTLFIILGVLAALGLLTLLSVRISGGELFILISCLTVPALVAFSFTLGTTEAAISPRTVSKRTGQLHLSVLPIGFDPPLKQEQVERLAQRSRFPRQSMYSMIIEDLEFRLTLEEHAALTPGVYTVYYIPTLNKIVAMELVAVTADGAPLPEVSELAAEIVPSGPVIVADPLDESDEDVRA
jgi:hypothetical protein